MIDSKELITISAVNEFISTTKEQIAFLERLLERISVSKYHDNFFLKGGFLLAAMVGLDTRATMDMDATIKGLPVTKNNIEDVW
ncbi:nucleotidyl transferase AbiEii/AbiGii toxin family protein [Eubacterium sp.]